jgi:hypothetical protein
MPQGNDDDFPEHVKAYFRRRNNKDAEQLKGRHTRQTFKHLTPDDIATLDKVGAALEADNAPAEQFVYAVH